MLVASVAGVGLAALGASVAVELAGRTAVGERTVSAAGLGVAYAVQAALAVVATVGFGLRYRRHGRDLDSWLALALTLVVFADLHYVLVPAAASSDLLQGDFLRLLSYGVLLVGVWRAISEAEFGRAVAEERSRVAQEIHDGLAQYLFAISTHVSMLETRVRRSRPTLPQLKQAADRGPAGGALRGARALVRERHGAVRRGAAPLRRGAHRRRRARRRARDRQRRASRARRADRGLPHRPGGARQRPPARRRPPGVGASIGWRDGRRVVIVRDDGVGFDGGQRRRRAGAEEHAAARGGDRRRLQPALVRREAGTAIEVVLRAA